MDLVTQRELNRWTLARQMLLDRVRLDAVTAIERLAGMQAQYPPSPYIGLYARLQEFRREELEMALRDDRVFKATLMRVTLHLISARDFGPFRAAAPHPGETYRNTRKLLEGMGIDLEVVRSAIATAVADRPLSRAELMALARETVSSRLEDPYAWGAVALVADLIHLPESGHFGHVRGGRYRPAPLAAVEGDEDAFRTVARAYLAAFGPASRADLAQWSGQRVGAFAAALDSMELISFRGEDGRVLLDLPEAPRPDPSIGAPVRFLPKWDNLLLAYDRRERVLPEPYRKIIIRKNGDVQPTFLVDGIVAGTWEAPLRGRAMMTLLPLRSMAPNDRVAVEEEAERLLGWLRPDAKAGEVHWAEIRE